MFAGLDYRLDKYLARVCALKGNLIKQIKNFSAKMT